MFTQAVLPDAILAIKKISHMQPIKEAYLAGGTALALQLGHRISEDLDFFTVAEFNEKALVTQLSAIESFNEDRHSWRTVMGWIGKTKFSIFYYKHPLINPTESYEEINIASKADIAAMKLRAIGDRGLKRDFIDLFFLSREYSLNQVFEFYDQKYGDLDDKIPHLLKSLSYFDDADNDDRIPKMLIQVDWDQVKSHFTAESMRLAKIKLNLEV